MSSADRDPHPARLCENAWQTGLSTRMADIDIALLRSCRSRFWVPVKTRALPQVRRVVKARALPQVLVAVNARPPPRVGLVVNARALPRRCENRMREKRVRENRVRENRVPH